jgi:ABC-type microcin C transport system duplicated ATPase subunit YejF
MSLSAGLIANNALPAPARPALEAVGISKSYLRGSGWFGKGTAFIAVRSSTLRILPKEILALVGESGSGKATLGKIIVGLERADKGSVRLGSETVFDTLTGIFVPPAKRKIGLIFQDPSSSPNPRMRVRELVGEGLALAGVSKSERAERTIDSLQHVGLLKDRSRLLPSSIQSRSAATRCHRASDRDASQVFDSGRVGLGARRFRADSDSESSARSSRFFGADDHFHHA